MKKIRQNRFERGIIKVVSLIGLLRFTIALIEDIYVNDGYADLYLDIASFGLFLVGYLLIQFNSTNRRIIAFFFVPLMILLWLSFYFHNGIASSTEINAFAIVLVLSLTTKGRLPLIFVSIFLLGVFTVLAIVEPKNIEYLAPSEYYTFTFTLLFVSVAIIVMTFHAKNVFILSRRELKDINQAFVERSEESKQKNKLLLQQNEKLNLLRSELEEKVLERTKILQDQKDSIEEYLRLTTIELIKPYQETVESIRNLNNPSDDQLINLIKDSGERLEVEMNKLKTRLIDSHE